MKGIGRIYYVLCMPSFHLVLAIFFSTADFANKTFFSFYDILLKNFIPLLLLLICPQIIGFFLKIPIKILFKNLLLQLTYLAFINIKYAGLFNKNYGKCNATIKEVKKIIKNTEYNPYYGLTGPKEQVKKAQKYMLEVLF